MKSMKIRVRLDEGRGLNSPYPAGVVLDDDGRIIGTADSYTYGGTAFAIHTRAVAGWYPFRDVEIVGPETPKG